jgi:hypothetical protein
METGVVSYKLKDSLPLVKNEGQAGPYRARTEAQLAMARA